MSALSFIWQSNQINLKTKYKIYCAIPISLLLWGCENLSGNKNDIDKLERFQSKSIRRIMNIKIQQVIDNRITNVQLLKSFYNINTISQMICKRQLKFVRKIICSKTHNIANDALTCTLKTKRERGRPQKNTWHAKTKNLKVLFPNLQDDSKIKGWKNMPKTEYFGNEL